jgi:hypothetical protein
LVDKNKVKRWISNVVSVSCNRRCAWTFHKERACNKLLVPLLVVRLVGVWVPKEKDASNSIRLQLERLADER